MTPELRRRLFDALLGDTEGIEPFVLNEFIQLVDDDLDSIEPVIDEYLESLKKGAFTVDPFKKPLCSESKPSEIVVPKGSH